MLAVLTAAVLGVALILALLSPENTVTVLVGGLGTFVLTPITLLVVVVFLPLSIVGSTQVLGGLESILEGLLTGAHGFEWGYYVALCVPLWLGVAFRIGETTEQKEDDPRTEEQVTDETTKDSKIETEELIELGGVDERTAEGLREAGLDSVEHVAAASQGQLQTVECVSTTLAAQIATETGDVEVSNRVNATVAKLGVDDETESDETAETTGDEDDGGDGETELTDISGVSEARADVRTATNRGQNLAVNAGIATEQTAPLLLSTAAGGARGLALQAGIAAPDVVPDLIGRADGQVRALAVRVDNDKRLPGELQDIDTVEETETDDETDDEQADDQTVEIATDIFDDEDDTVEISELTDISGVTEPSAHALREAGYNSAEDVRSADKDELLSVNGVSTPMAAVIHSDPGDSDSDATVNSRTANKEAEAEQTETERSSDHHGAAPVTDQQTETTGSAGVSDESEADSGHDERSVEGLRDTVESLWEQATTDPLSDPDATRADLIQVHTRAVELAERAAEHDRPEPLGFAQETLDRAEQRLDALPEIVDTLNVARERVPPERGPSDAIRTQSLQRAREYYNTAIETAQQVGFSTTRVERERDQIQTELASREAATTAPPSRFESESEPDHNSETDVDPDTASASASEVADESDGTSGSADESTADSGLQFGAAAKSDSASPPASDTGDESGGESGGTSGGESSPTTSTDARTEQGSSAAPDTTQPIEPTRADYVEAIQQVADASDRVVKSTDVSEQSPYSVTEVVNAFDSWQDALETAGVDNEARLLEELCRVADEVDGRPTTRDVNEYAHVSATMYNNYFGSYMNAVERASVNQQSTKTKPTNEGENCETEQTGATDPSRQTLCAELQRLDTTNSGYPMTTEMRADGSYNPETYYDEFGSWEDALEAAGINKRQRLIDDIRRVAERVNKRPSTADMNEYGTHSSGTYTGYFDDWNTAVAAAGLAEESTESEERSPPSGSASHSVTSSESDPEAPAIDPKLDSFTVLGDITEDGRLDQPIAVQILELLNVSGDRKETSLAVEDIEGDRCQMNLWRTHSDEVTWNRKVSHWYMLSNARGKTWTTDDGETKRRLSSTRDLDVHHVGTDPPVNMVKTASPGTTKNSERTADESEQADSVSDATELRSKTVQPANDQHTPDSERAGGPSVEDSQSTGSESVSGSTGQDEARPDISPSDFAELSGFQRDILTVLAGLETANGLKIKEELEQYSYETVNHGRLYPNLDTLVEKELVEKGKIDKRTNSYRLTRSGSAQIRQRVTWQRARMGARPKPTKMSESELSSSRNGSSDSGPHSKPDEPDDSESAESERHSSGADRDTEKGSDDNTEDLIDEIMDEFERGI